MSEFASSRGGRWVRQDQLVAYFLVIFTFWIVCLVEAVQKFSGQSLDPRFWMLLSVLITVSGGLNVFRLHGHRRHLPAAGRAGMLTNLFDALRPQGWITYDCAGERGLEVDYALVGPGGIYIIKLKEGNVFGSGTIDYTTANALVFGGKISDNRPLKQASAGARSIGDALQNAGGKQNLVRPMVVFSGDWKIKQPSSTADVIVITAKELEDFLLRQQAALTLEQIETICARLEAAAFAQS